MSHADDAEKNFKSGCNCCQSVLLAYAAEHGLKREDALRLGSGFGGGMGGMGRTCGAVTAAFMVIGLKHPRTDRTTAGASATRVQDFACKFCELNQSISCRELLGMDISTDQGMAKARALGLFENLCPRLVRDAANLLDELL